MANPNILADLLGAMERTHERHSQFDDPEMGIVFEVLRGIAALNRDEKQALMHFKEALDQLVTLLDSASHDTGLDPNTASKLTRAADVLQFAAPTILGAIHTGARAREQEAQLMACQWRETLWLREEAVAAQRR